MIIENYSTFRTLANPGGPLAADSLPEFDPANMRKLGFNGGITGNPLTSFPIELTCNAYATDAVDGVDEYDWFVSQQTSVVANKPFAVYRLDTGGTRSGSIGLDLSAWAATEYPTPFDLSSIQVLFFAVDIYVIRRSDGAIQRRDMKAYLLDANSPKTSIG
jgi:hypothetical protein